jgi:hydrogenase maturation protease
MTHGDHYEALVIGFGNEWRGDDGIGPEVARRIEAFQLPGVRVLVAQQLVPELAQTLSVVERAFFVDACLGPRTSAIAVEPLMEDCAGSLATHISSPHALLTLSRILYGRSPRAWLVTIEGTRFELGESLSQIARGRVKQAAEHIAAMLRTSGIRSAQNSTSDT